MIYELTKELETGNNIIDTEHRELFRHVNILMDECSKGKGRTAIGAAMNFLIDYVNKHFSHEDSLQKDSGYPNKSAHHQFHQNYKAKLNSIAAQIPTSGPTLKDLADLNTHIGVLISHIKTEDKKLAEFLKTK